SLRKSRSRRDPRLREHHGHRGDGLAPLPGRHHRRARPGEHDERADQRGAAGDRAERAGETARAGRLPARGGGLLSPASRRPPAQSGGGDPLVLLAREPLRAAYLLHGEETFLVERALVLLTGRLSPGDRPASRRTLWAGEDPERLATALDDLASPLLFSGAQILVVPPAEALAAKDDDLVLATASRLAATGTFILVAAPLGA